MRLIGYALFTALFLFSEALPAMATEFTWKDASGSEFNLADIQQPVALHFWATWCVPCRDELPELAAWKKEHQDVKVVTISLDRKTEMVDEFLSEEGVDLPVLLAKSSDSMRLGVRGLPSTVVLSADGDIKKLYTGPVPWNDEEFTREFLDLMQP